MPPEPYLLVLLASCARASLVPSASDRVVYEGIVAAPHPDDLRRCAAIVDRDLAGDCALVVASTDSPGGHLEESACASVPEGTWRDECWFEAAEAANRAGRPDDAVAACGKAGKFVDPCDYHLWQQDVTAGLDADLDVGLVRAQVVHDTWAPRFGAAWRWTGEGLPLGSADRTFEGVFWGHVFDEEIGLQAIPDIAGCDDRGAKKAACIAGTLDVLRRRAVHVGHGCRPVARDRDGWAAAGVPYVEDPRVDAALQQPCASSAD